MVNGETKLLADPQAPASSKTQKFHKKNTIPAEFKKISRVPNNALEAFFTNRYVHNSGPKAGTAPYHTF